MSQNLSSFGSSSESMDKTNWNALDYSCCRDEAWYSKHFPGFDEEIIKILVHCDGTNSRKDCEKNEWEKRQALKKELKDKLIVKFD